MTGAPVHGLDLDPATRCRHYHSERDIVAIRMKCCGDYYACIACHAAIANHPPAVWPAAEWDARAVRCGICATEMSIAGYLACGDHCPACAAAFNPFCRDHHHYYFDVAPAANPG
jgi:uncharacterized CHY-type Zn-finger protein